MLSFVVTLKIPLDESLNLNEKNVTKQTSFLTMI